MRYVDRSDAGRQLAQRLSHLRSEHVVVLGLPRGGVPVAYEVAKKLGAPLDVLVVRKLGVPFQPELGMGAIGEDGIRLINASIVRSAGVQDRDIDEVEARERAELSRRVRRFRGDRRPISLTGRTVIVVDDGLATGFTARVGCRVARERGASWVILAVPVAGADALATAAEFADEVVCLTAPRWFRAIGQFYDSFGQTSDAEVVSLLERASGRPNRDGEVDVVAGKQRLPGHLIVPRDASGVVLFAHGSGSSRHSPRNRFVADQLNAAGLGTLLFDLLVPPEDADRANVFDIPLLAGRLAAATRWIREEPATAGHWIGYFGASTGAAAALWAAAEPDLNITAVVSRGGRPDLAADRLPLVSAPTLLIVGGSDRVVLDLNRQALAALRCECDLRIVSGATHLFEEPGTLLTVAEQARAWFLAHASAST
jgi:putative phosphoribosyl transferase